MIEIAPSPAVERRNPDRRREHRARRFREYFAGSRPLSVAWQPLAVYPDPSLLTPNRLVALEDPAGFTAGLGIVLGREEHGHRVRLLTKLDSLSGIEALRIGDLQVDPTTFRDRMVRQEFSRAEVPV